MPKMHISRSQVINAPVTKVHQILSDMSQWQAWSPWLISEPEAKVNVRADNKYYTWKGSRVGEGQMEVTSETPSHVEYDLKFLKPWKSHAKVAMDMQPHGNGTEVTWSMDSSLPFFMFFMKKLMGALIGNDCERGLRLLKDYAEDGEVHSKLNFIGEQDYPGNNYICIKRSCHVDEMPLLMKDDFTKLMSAAHNIKGFKPDEAFSMYHKWDMVKKQVSYTAGVPYEGDKPEVDFAHETGSIPATKIYTLEHVGPYEHLGNAWSTLYNMQRNKEIKVKKGIHPFETYGNSPMNTEPKDLISRINFAVK